MAFVKNLFGLAMLTGALAFGEEVYDWRLDMLKKKGLSPETAALENFLKRVDISEEKLAKLTERLGDEAFAEREKAQKEILLLGKDALHLLRKLPEFDDPEVQMRLRKIEKTLLASDTMAEDALMLRAVSSLLHDRKNPGVANPEGKLFVELFNKEQAGIKDGYHGLRYGSDAAMKGSVSGGILRLDGKRDGEGDQRLFFDAKHFTGNAEFPEQFRVSVKLGGGDDGAGTYHVGVSIGNVRVLFHPAFQQGAFRIQRADNQAFISQNTEMGFHVESEKLLNMTIDVKRSANGQVSLNVLVTNGKDSYRVNQTVSAEIIGKMDRVSLDRSGRSGGDALFDDLIVDLVPPR